MDGIIGCYPFQDSEPFILKTCPHVFFVGNQPRFETALVRHHNPHTTSSASASPSSSKRKHQQQHRDDEDEEMKDDDDEEDDGGEGQGKVRLISLPRFKETGEVVLLDLETLEVELLRFDVFNQ